MSIKYYNYCYNCLQYAAFESIETFTDGSVAVSCMNCRDRILHHRCGSYGLGDLPLTLSPLVEQGLRWACPRCMGVYDLANRIEAIPNAPDWVEPLAEAVKYVAIGAAIGAGIIAVREMLSQQST